MRRDIHDIINSEMIEIVPPNELAAIRAKAQRENYRRERRAEIAEAAFRVIRFVFFTPLGIAARITAMLAKMIGYIFSIGLPFGIYYLYKAMNQFLSGNNLAAIEWDRAAFLVGIPFIAFLVSQLFDGAADLLEEHAG